MTSGVSGFSAETRRVVLIRTTFRCDRCGLRNESGDFHHRTPRGMGGSKNPALGLPSNCLYLHRACHDTVESNREKFTDAGFLVPAGTDPKTVPVMLWNGWHLLNDVGQALPMKRPHLRLVTGT